MTKDKNNEESLWELASFIVGSPNRQTILAHLDVRPFTPSQLADLSELDITHVSRTLTQLREKGVVKLLVDEDRQKGRIYGVTEQGKTLIEEQHSVIFNEVNGGRAEVFTRSSSNESEST